MSSHLADRVEHLTGAQRWCQMVQSSPVVRTFADRMAPVGTWADTYIQSGPAMTKLRQICWGTWTSCRFPATNYEKHLTSRKSGSATGRWRLSFTSLKTQRRTHKSRKTSNPCGLTAGTRRICRWFIGFANLCPDETSTRIGHYLAKSVKRARMLYITRSETRPSIVLRLSPPLLSIFQLYTFSTGGQPGCGGNENQPVVGA